MTDALTTKVRKYTPRCIDKLVGVDPQIILDRVAKGDLLREIAADYGCAQQTVSEFVKRHVDPDEWMAVRELSIQARLEKSIADIESAPDQLVLARARESARLWMWRAEREHGHRWGAKPSTAVQINGADGSNIQIVSYASHTAEQQQIDGDADNRTIITTPDDAPE